MKYTVRKTVDFHIEIEAPSAAEALSKAEWSGLGNWTHVDEHVTGIEDQDGGHYDSDGAPLDEDGRPILPPPEWSKYDPATQWLCLIEHVGPVRRQYRHDTPFLDGLAVPRTRQQPLTQDEAIGIRDRAMAYAVRTHGGEPKHYLITIRGRDPEGEKDSWMFSSKIGCRVTPSRTPHFPAPYDREET